MTLTKEYMEQMKKQLDLKLALTIKFMNSSPILEETVQMSSNGPRCGERLLPIVKADNSVYFDCLDCGYSGQGVESSKEQEPTK